jgi:hypothetical protein
MFSALLQKRAFPKQDHLPVLTLRKPLKKRPHAGQTRRETSIGQ